MSAGDYIDYPNQCVCVCVCEWLELRNAIASYSKAQIILMNVW